MAAPNHVITDSSNPAQYAEVVVPSDTVNFTKVPRAIYVGGAGNITAVMADGAAVLFSGVTAGAILPIRAKRINLTATTATLMVALF